MIDKQAILERVDLLSLAEHDTQLRKVASTGGGEYAGPCPFCGGRDRFRVQPHKSPWGLWMCRSCTGGKWQNAIDYVIARDGCDFLQACKTLNGGDLPTTRQQRPAPEIPADDAPADDWQALAWRVLEESERRLWQPEGEKALNYLRRRGLQDETIRAFRLGYYPRNEYIQEDIWIDRGIVIPCVVAGEIWYLKVRRAAGKDRYRCMSGSRTKAIYNADDLIGSEIALFVEGEIDCMTAWQELRDVVAVATLGAAKNTVDLATWGAYFMVLRVILAAYDNDQAGQAGADNLADLTDRALPCPLPDGVKDINDYYQAGGDLWAWLKAHLIRLGVLQALELPA